MTDTIDDILNRFGGKQVPPPRHDDGTPLRKDEILLEKCFSLAGSDNDAEERDQEVPGHPGANGYELD